MVKVFKSIRFRTLLAMTLCVAFLFITTTLIASSIISGRFSQIENQKVSENLGRLEDTYKFDLANLSTKLSDWSTWDDTYKFIEDKNQAYIDSNLVYSTLANLKVNYMIFVNTEGKIVESIGVDSASKGKLDGIPADLQALITKDSEIVNHEEVAGEKTGLIMLKEGPLMFASRPIVTSNGEGPIRGSLLFARYLDDQEVKSLSDIVHLAVTASLINDNLPANFKEAYANLTADQNGYIKPQSATVTNGYILVKDFYGKPALIFKIDYPRDITIEGYKSINYFIYGFILTGLLFIFVLEFFLSRFLINRIESLSHEVNKIGDSGSIDARVTQTLPEDEIYSLTSSINGMLDKLTQSQQDVQKEREKVNTFFDIVSGIVVILSRGGKILSINKKGCEFLGISADEATGKDWFDFIPEKDRDWLKNIFEEIVEDGQISKYEYFEHAVLNKEGNSVLFGWYNSVLRDKDGEIIATVSHGENVAKIGS